MAAQNKTVVEHISAGTMALTVRGIIIPCIRIICSQVFTKDGPPKLLSVFLTCRDKF